MCNGGLTVEKVSKALTRMFCGDSKPNAKDSVLDEVYYYQDDDWYGDGGCDDHTDEVEYTGEADKEVPQELDEASIAVEDAYINYLDSRKKMRELALSRGFYPVVTIDMSEADQKPRTW